MRTIYKYELREIYTQTILMPIGAQLLHVGSQYVTESTTTSMRTGTFLMLWALVDTDRPLIDRRITVVATGRPVPEPWDGVYVGTAVLGEFVWHVFDGGERDSKRVTDG